MKNFILRRTAEGLLALIALTFIIFVSAHASGDPALYLLPPEASTSEDYERMQEVLGLDKPLMVQYSDFLVNAVQGDFGTSIRTRRPVSEMLMERIPATAQLAFSAIAVSLVVGIPLGVVSALRKRSLFDRGARMMSIFGMAAPQFWVAIMLIMLFAASLNWLPSFGRGGWTHLILPVVTLSLTIVAGVIRLARSSMIEALESDYVKYARMRGLSHWRVTWKHALRNALVPVLTFSGIMLAALLNGTVVIEQVFAWPGLGRLTLDAVIQRDFPLLQGSVVLAGSFYILVAFIVDVVYAVIDPRIRRTA